jgi:hypothetical protein
MLGTHVERCISVLYGRGNRERCCCVPSGLCSAEEGLARVHSNKLDRVGIEFWMSIPVLFAIPTISLPPMRSSMNVGRFVVSENTGAD